MKLTVHQVMPQPYMLHSACQGATAKALRTVGQQVYEPQYATWELTLLCRWYAAAWPAKHLLMAGSCRLSAGCFDSRSQGADNHRLTHDEEATHLQILHSTSGESSVETMFWWNICSVHLQQQEAWAKQWPGNNLRAKDVQPQQLGVPPQQPELPSNGHAAAKEQPSQQPQKSDDSSKPQPSSLAASNHRPYQPELYADAPGQSSADALDAEVMPVASWPNQTASGFSHLL